MKGENGIYEGMKVYTGYLDKSERYDVTLLCFVEIVLVTLLNKQKNPSRRYNQYAGAIEKIKQIDKTYHGYLPLHYQGVAEKMLNKIEADLVALIKEDTND